MTPTTARIIKALVAGSALLGSLAIALAPAGAEPNAGDLDVTFNGTGVAETTVRNDIVAGDIARTADGRLLVIADRAVWRFNPDGTVDTSFGVQGAVRVRTEPGMSPTRVVSLPDGRFVVAGFVGTPQGPTFGAARLLADGTPDPTFGTDTDGDGAADQIPFFAPDSFETVFGDAILVVQSTGHVVLIGRSTTGNQTAVGRISPNGVAGDVRTITAPVGLSVNLLPSDAVVDADDRVIVAAAAINPGNAAVALRLDANLAPDTTFDADGFAVQPAQGTEFVANELRVATLPDRTVGILVEQAGDLNGVFLFRWASNGRFLGRTGAGFDAAFEVTTLGSLVDLGAEGFAAAVSPLDRTSLRNRAVAVVRFDASGRELGRLVVERPAIDLDAAAAVSDTTGGVIVAGEASEFPDARILLARFTDDSELDDGFGDGGLALIPGGGRDVGEAVAAAPDGGVIVGGGFDFGESGRQGFVVRHNPDGRLDARFGGAGRAPAGVTTLNEIVHGVAVDEQGRILAVSEGFDGDDGAFGTVTRLLPQGTPDPSFGFAGEARIPAPEDDVRLNAVTVDSEGRIVVVGTSEEFDDSDSFFQILVARLTPEGRPDQDFNQGNPMVLPVEAVAGEGRAVAIQPDGSIVVVGSLESTSLADPCCSVIVIARVNENGSFDETFNPGGDSDGLRREGITGAVNRGTGVAIRPDGRIVVAGFAAEITETEPPGATGPPTALVVQLLPNGERDPSFGDDGLFTTDGRVSAVVGGLAIDAEGNTVVAGSGGQISDPEPPAPPPPPPEADDVVLVRVTPAGTFDAGFGDNGVVWTDLGGVEAAAGVAIDPGGRIVIGGTNQDESTGSRVLAARYHSVTVVEEPPPPEDPQEPEPPASPPTVFTPSVSFNPGVGRAGQTTTAVGTGFPPGGTITFDWSQGIDAVAPVTAGADGSFTVNVLVLPSEIFGNRLLTAATTDPATGAPVSATAPYLVAIGTSQPGDFVGRR